MSRVKETIAAGVNDIWPNRSKTPYFAKRSIGSFASKRTKPVTYFADFSAIA